MNELDLELLDQKLRNGEVVEVRRVLRSIAPAELKRSQIVRLANLSRRTGLIQLGMRLLNPVVRADGADDATPEEKIEYAVLLSRIGATIESRSILQKLDAKTNPDSILYQTFSLTPEWRYEETIPLLEKYILMSDKKPYMQLVAMVNLAAAYVYLDRAEEAEQVISAAMTYAKKNNHQLLYANLLELSAQTALQRKNFGFAATQLEKSMKIMSGADTSESLYVEKWKAVLRVSRRAGKVQRENLEMVRANALQKAEWETVRDCDFHIATKYEDWKLLTQLYFGTPFSSYRKKLEKFGPELSSVLSFVWHPDLSSKSDSQLDIEKGSDRTGRQIIPLMQMPHRLLRVLAKDFYRPQRFAELGAQLFPNEYFDPVYTPLKIHKICTRLRQSLLINEIPNQVTIVRHAASLSGGGGILINNNQLSGREVDDKSQKVKVLLEALRNRFSERSFSSHEAAKAWKCSVSTASRRINEGIALGFCVQLGSGKGSTYRLARL